MKLCKKWVFLNHRGWEFLAFLFCSLHLRKRMYGWLQSPYRISPASAWDAVSVVTGCWQSQAIVTASQIFHWYSDCSECPSTTKLFSKDIRLLPSACEAAQLLFRLCKHKPRLLLWSPIPTSPPSIALCCFLSHKVLFQLFSLPMGNGVR